MISFSNTTDKVFKAFITAQAAIKNSTRDSRGNFGSYSSLTSVIEAVKSELNANGLAFSQSAERTDAGINVTTVFMHESGEWFSTLTGVPLDKATAQGAGSSISYARRYGLSAAVGIGAEDDDGQSATDGQTGGASNPRVTYPTPQAKAVGVEDSNDPVLKFGAATKGKRVSELTQAQLIDTARYLQKQVDEGDQRWRAGNQKLLDAVTNFIEG